MIIFSAHSEIKFVIRRIRFKEKIFLFIWNLIFVDRVVNQFLVLCNTNAGTSSNVFGIIKIAENDDCIFTRLNNIFSKEFAIA